VVKLCIGVFFLGLPASSGLSEASIRLGSVEMGGRVRLTLFGFWDGAQFSPLKASPRRVPGVGASKTARLIVGHRSVFI